MTPREFDFDRIYRAVEREQDILDKQLEDGVISREEYRKSLRDLQRECSDYAQEEQRREDWDQWHT